jgi:hypothetical protein
MLHRSLALLCVFGGIAVAEPKQRECKQLQAPDVTVTTVGCFAGPLTICLVRSATDVCSGVFVVPKMGSQIIETVRCGGNGGTLTFKGSWVTCNMAGDCPETKVSFNGAVAGDRLRGKYTEADETTRVSWRRSRSKLDAKALVAAACKRPKLEPRRRADEIDSPFLD